MTARQAPAAEARSLRAPAAGISVHDAVESMAAAGDHGRAAALWESHLRQVVRETQPVPIDVATAPQVWVSKVRCLGARTAVDDLVDAFQDAR